MKVIDRDNNYIGIGFLIDLKGLERLFVVKSLHLP